MLHRQIEQDELLTYCERHQINVNNCFLLIFIKITPLLDLAVTDINHIQDLVKGYCGTCKAVYNTLLHPGELIFIIELAPKSPMNQRAIMFIKYHQDCFRRRFHFRY